MGQVGRGRATSPLTHCIACSSVDTDSRQTHNRALGCILDVWDFESISDEQLLTSVPVDIDNDTPGFQVARGYTLTWTQGPRWSLEVFGPDGASTGW